MTASFTPGPWTSYPCSLEKYSRVITAKRCMVQVAYTGLNHYDQVAMTKEVYGDRTTYGPGEETTANARLIVAAPDMYAALKNINSLDPQESSTTEWNDAFMQVRAVLAKAEGNP